MGYRNRNQNTILGYVDDVKDGQVRLLQADSRSGGGSDILAVTSPLNSAPSDRVSVTILSTSIASVSEYDVFASTSYASFTQGVNWDHNATAAGIVYTPADGRFTVSQDGSYKIDVTLFLLHSSSNTCIIDINKNGVTIWTSNPFVHSSVDPVERTAIIIEDMVAGDYIEVTVDGVNSITIQPGTSFSMHRIDPDVLQVITGLSGTQGSTFSGQGPAGAVMIWSDDGSNFLSGTGQFTWDKTEKTLTLSGTMVIESGSGDFIVNGGRIGVNTFAPDKPLHALVDGTAVSGFAGSTAAIFQRDAGAANISIVSSNVSSGYVNFGHAGDQFPGSLQYQNADNSMRFNVNSSERVRIDNAGNVGIGETVPAAKLHVWTSDSGVTPTTSADELFVEGSGHAGITIGAGATSIGFLNFGDSSDADVGQVYYDHNTNHMQLVANASIVMTLDDVGNASVNNTSPPAAWTHRSTGLVDTTRPSLSAFGHITTDTTLPSSKFWTNFIITDASTLLGSQGSFRGNLTWNGTRSNDPANGNWTIFGVNSFDEYASMEMGELGVRFLVSSGTIGTGNSAPTSRMRITPEGLMSVGPEANDPVLGLQDDGTDYRPYNAPSIGAVSYNAGVLESWFYMHNGGSPALIMSGGSELRIGFDNGTVGGSYTERMRLTGDGHLGVRTSAPQGVLELEDGGTATGRILKITQDDASVWGWIMTNDSYNTSDDVGLGAWVNNSGVGFIRSTNGALILNDTGQNVGVGVSSPSSVLDVSGTLTVTPAGTVSTIRTNNTNARMDFVAARTTSTNQAFRFWDGTNTHMSITDAGIVTIEQRVICNDFYGYLVRDGTSQEGMIFYADASNGYILLTNAASTSFNSLRPFRIGLTDGDVYLANAQVHFDHSTGRINVGDSTDYAFTSNDAYQLKIAPWAFALEFPHGAGSGVNHYSLYSTYNYFNWDSRIDPIIYPIHGLRAGHVITNFSFRTYRWVAGTITVALKYRDVLGTSVSTPNTTTQTSTTGWVTTTSSTFNHTVIDGYFYWFEVSCSNTLTGLNDQMFGGCELNMTGPNLQLATT